jgi:quercetin dioxygenase-like cupin family protein
MKTQMKTMTGRGNVGFFGCGAVLSAFLISAMVAQTQSPAAPETIRLKQHPVKLDAKRGVGFARLGEGRMHQVEVTLVELPPGKQLPQERVLAEEMIYIVSGQGYTMMWNRADGKKERYNWKEGDFLSPTMNSWRQHFNASSSQPARYLVVSTAPLTRTMFHNAAILNSVEYNFDERWTDNLAHPEATYIPGGEGSASVRMKVGHLLPDLRNREMKVRGEGQLGITITPEEGDMANNHLLEMEVREFMRPDATSPEHRHVWETVYFILKGDGYALLQNDGGPERRVEWTEGDLFLVGANEWHNHRARNGAGGRFLQIKPSGYFREVGLDPYLMQNKPGSAPRP